MSHQIIKKILRKEFLKKRNSLTVNYIESASKKISLFLLQSNEYKKYQNIGLYYSFGSEVKTLNLIDTSLKNNKNVGLPVILNKEKMLFYHINELNINDIILKISKYGINEPNLDYYSLINSIDLLVVPGICFDNEGNRIGYGKGYYDKFIMSSKPTFVMGLSYVSQVLESKIPFESNDQKMNGLITENGVTYF